MFKSMILAMVIFFGSDGLSVWFLNLLSSESPPQPLSGHFAIVFTQALDFLALLNGRSLFLRGKGSRME